MRTTLVAIGVVVVGLLSASCSAEEPDSAAEAAGSPDTADSTASVELPPDPEPESVESCPFLDTEFVAETNGQRVQEVKTSSDEPHPACFFYRPDGGLQLTVRVYVGEADIAQALVDTAAPVATSNPTAQPTGWQGGYESTDDGAVYAVAKDGNAVIVTTNQEQSVKARTVATEAITSLGI